VRECLLNRDAQLLVERGRFVIEINSMFSEVRRRLSLAHELGHVIVNEQAGQRFVCARDADSATERLCNDIGTELLVPDCVVDSHFQSGGLFPEMSEVVTAPRVLRAASAFKVSIDVMAKRLFSDLRIAPSVAI